MNEDDIKNADVVVGVDSNGVFSVSVVNEEEDNVDVDSFELNVVDVNDIMESIVGVDLIVISIVLVVIIEDIADIKVVADDVVSFKVNVGIDWIVVFVAFKDEVNEVGSWEITVVDVDNIVETVPGVDFIASIVSVVISGDNVDINVDIPEVAVVDVIGIVETIPDVDVISVDTFRV